ncbi:MAG: hypothetical protein ACRDRD_04255 [Pseudonocardiaceae bacterium]
MATVAEAPGADQQGAWLGLGPEVIHAPVRRAGSTQIIGISALVVVVVVAAVVYFLVGGSPDRSGSGQITAPPTTVAPRARPVVPSVPASAPPVTAAAPVTTPAVPLATPEAPVVSAAPVVPPAAPGPAEIAPGPPSARSAGGANQERRAAVVPAPRSPAHSGGEDLRQGATSEDQSPPPSEDQPAPGDAVSPPSPDPSSAPEGFTRVPSKPWHPQAPQ